MELKKQMLDKIQTLGTDVDGEDAPSSETQHKI
jgi:hypothetical protein